MTMKRMAALFAVMGALTGVVPATAVAAEGSGGGLCQTVFLLHLC